MPHQPLSKSEQQSLEQAVGHVFKNKDRLDRAMTHSSARTTGGKDYERLEFLGDRVLGLCVAELLYDTYGNADEGELSVRLNQLVSATTCAEISDELSLHQFIRTGADVKKITGKRMLNVRADVVEALIAALYLDGGLEVARNFIVTHWKDRAASAESARRDAKTELQEWAHARFNVTPAYQILDRSGPDHDPRFVVRVDVKGVAPAEGNGRSKRIAEQEAASRLLQREGVWT